MLTGNQIDDEIVSLPKVSLQSWREKTKVQLIRPNDQYIMIKHRKNSILHRIPAIFYLPMKLNDKHLIRKLV